MPQSLAEYAQLHFSLGAETAFVARRGLRTLRWSYRQMAELEFRVARELESRSIGKGDRVMLRGAVAVPMDKIASPDFAQRVAADVDAKLIIGSSALATHAAGRPYLVLETLADTLAGHSADLYSPSTLSRDDTAQIVFTSGTTADP